VPAVVANPRSPERELALAASAAAG